MFVSYACIVGRVLERNETSYGAIASEVQVVILGPHVVLI